MIYDSGGASERVATATADGRYEQALEQFLAARQLAPENAGICFEIVGILRRLDRAEEAEAVAREVVALEPGLAQAHRVLGLVSRDRKNHSAALEHFKNALHLNPDDVWNEFELAQEHRLLGNHIEALEHYRASLELKPDFAEAHRCIALVEAARGDTLAARQHFEDALATLENSEAPLSHDDLLRVAESLLDLGRVIEAKQRLDLVQQHSVSASTLFRTLCTRAAAARLTMDKEDEIASLKAAIYLATDLKSAWTKLAVRQVSTGRFDDAIETIAQANVSFPNDPSLMIEKARALRAIGRFEASRALLEGIATSDNLSVPTAVQLSDELRCSKNFSAAYELAYSVIEQEPDNVAARLSLALIVLERDGPTAALAILDEAISALRMDVGVVVQALRLMRLTGKTEECSRLLDKCELDWRSPSAIFQELTQALIFVGRTTKVAEYLERRKHFFGSNDDDLFVELELARSSGNTRMISSILKDVLAKPILHPGVAACVAEMANIVSDFRAVVAAQMRLIAIEPARELPGMIIVAYAEFNMGNRTRALEILDELSKRFNDAEEICSMRARILKESGDVGQALNVLEEGVQRFPDSVALWAQQTRLTMVSIGWQEAKRLHDAAIPRSHNWLEQKKLIEIELHLEAFDYAAALSAMDGFLPSYTANRVQYFQSGAKAALGAVDLRRAQNALACESSITRFDRRLRGQSSNISQSLLGQLLDEYRLDYETVTALREADALSSETRSDSLLTLAKGNPNSTAAAITTLVQLRRLGWFSLARSQATSPIPKRIAQFWDTKYVPSDIAAYMHTWRSKNEAWSHEVFDAVSAQSFISVHCAKEVLIAFQKASDATLKADLFRLAWICANGGVYADADDVCTGPIESVLGGGHRIVGYQEDIGSMGNNFLASVAGHPVISWALAEATAAILRGDREMPWLVTGPGLLSRSFVRWLASCPTLADGVQDGRLLHRSDVSKVCASHCHASYKNTTLHWSRGLFG